VKLTHKTKWGGTFSLDKIHTILSEKIHQRFAEGKILNQTAIF
jgi:hypothetical protein